MSTNETRFRVIDETGNNNDPVNIRAKDETEACVKVARQWFGALPGCIMDAVLPKVKAIAYTPDGRITKIEGMVGLPGRACLPPSIDECKRMGLGEKSDEAQ